MGWIRDASSLVTFGLVENTFNKEWRNIKESLLTGGNDLDDQKKLFDAMVNASKHLIPAMKEAVIKMADSETLAGKTNRDTSFRESIKNRVMSIKEL